MSVLSTNEQILFNVAKAALPSWLFTDEANQQELIAAFAKQFAEVWSTVDFLVDQVYILRAVSTFLDELAKDRGTRRQLDETDDALAIRLRQVDDAVTLPALEAHIIAILDSYAITIPDGYPGLLELRERCAHYGTSRNVFFVAISPSLIADGKIFTIGTNVFEFDKTGAWTAGRTRVNIAGLFGSADVAAAMGAALVTVYGAENVSVSSNKVLVRNALGVVSNDVSNIAFISQRKASYYTRGYRFGGEQNTLVVMLPYGTGADAQASVAEMLRRVKAGGVDIVVERRLNP